MAEDKELLKKDIIMIIKMDSMIHYENMEEVKKIYDTIIEKKMISTSMGQRYIKKLEQVLEGNNKFNCLFCGSEIADKKLICNECLSKIHVKKVQPVQKNTEQEAPEQENASQEISTQENPEQVQDEQEYSDNLDEEATVLKQSIKEVEMKKTSIVKESGTGLSKTLKIAAIAVFLVCAIAIIGVFVNKPDSSDSDYSKEISSIDDAMLVMESLFPSEEYSIKFQQELYPAEKMFDGEIGEYCGENWSNTKTIDAYLFTVQGIENPHDSCMCYVSIDGRVIGYGNLIYEADTSAFFRLR